MSGRPMRFDNLNTKRAAEQECFGHSHALPEGPSKAELREQLAQAARNTAAMAAAKNESKPGESA